MRTFATLAFAPAFFAAGVTFFPAFLDGAWQYVNRVKQTRLRNMPHHQVI